VFASPFPRRNSGLRRIAADLDLAKLNLAETAGCDCALNANSGVGQSKGAARLHSHGQMNNLLLSAANPKFARSGGKCVCELRVQKRH